MSGTFLTKSTRSAVMFLTVAAQGQWIDYPTAHVPRTPSGTPNLGAPAPRMPGGKPDFSGMWEAENRPCPKEGCADMRTSEQFFDLGARLPGGLPYQPWARALMQQRKAADGGGDTTTRCLPPGVPRIHTLTWPRKYVQTPDLLLILDESTTGFRQIFLDGRPLQDDPQRAFNGYSVGTWEGDTLVVHTNGLRDGLWLDRNGSPMTDAAKVTERFQRINYGNMRIEVTVDDPKAYTKPWTVTLNQYIMIDTELLEDICLDNEKDIPHLKPLPLKETK
jgi:hypothetical protein